MVKSKTLFTGDNLPIMRGMNNRSVDLIYLDPPFNSNHNYAAPIGSLAAGTEFKDTWTLQDVDVAWVDELEKRNADLYTVIVAVGKVGGKSYMSYLIYMAVRMLEMHRVLKNTGSVYLHCDPTMSHSLKLMMDAIFNKKNFRNEIVWCYRGAGYPRNDFGRRHDIILRYTKTNDYTFNVDDVRDDYAEATKERFKHYIGNVRKSGDFGEQTLHPKGKHPDDWWQIQPIAPSSKERTGYPTQKPLILLERIVKASSHKGDVVFDPFCGCATTLVVAEKLRRQWIGIDISRKAVDLVKMRLHHMLTLGENDYDKEALNLSQGIVIHRTDIPKRTDLGKLPPYRSHKDTLYGSQSGDCVGCGEHFLKKIMEIDHIIPKKDGGTDHIENLQLLCSSCNKIKSDRTMEALLVSLSEKQGKRYKWRDSI